MSLQDLIVLLPCHSLEDLSLDRSSEQAEELLSAWSALFHPALLAAAQSVPGWDRADSPPREPAGTLIILPPCCEALMPADWVDRASAAGARLIRNLRHRDEMVTAALGHAEADSAAVDPALTADFLALGFCHLQVELLTRQLRYMSNLDEVQFQAKTIAAAERAVKGEAESAREDLRSAFDLLTEAREYFYPVETHLVDLTLVASTTLGEPLRQELAAGRPTNLLVSGRVVQQMALQEPRTLAVLKDALEKGTANLIGGEFDEQELPLLSIEVILDQLQRGSTSYDRYLDRCPAIFGRRRFGLSPTLPQILRKLGYSGALHFTLDDGRFPTGNQSKIRWVGNDSTAIEALTRLPLDATRPRCFLALPETLGDAMDLDHAATAVFAVLGRFISITEYFRETEYTGQSTRYKPDQYRSPYLRQSVAAREADPISRWVRYHRRRAAAEAVQSLNALADLAAGTGKEQSAGRDLLRDVEDSRSAEPSGFCELDDRLSRRLQEAAHRLSSSLRRDKAAVQKGCLLTNPWSFSRRVFLDVSELARLPDAAGAVWIAAESGGLKQAVVDLPPMGFAWVGPGSAAPRPPREPPAKRKPRKTAELPMAEENSLRNEFFEVTLDPVTGALQSLRDYRTRGNRLAQQIALRLPRSAQTPHDTPARDESENDYSVMAADQVSVTSPGPLLGELTVRGRLMAREGRQVARFAQRLRARRGSRVLELDIELDIDEQPGPDPWDSYYAVRFAWGDATADVYRSANLASVPTDAAQVEAPHFVDVRGEKTRTTILTGGLPYHRRFGLRKLDTLLVVRGERARSFRLGVGIDLPQPVPAALDFVAPHALLTETSPPTGSAGWLFHLDSRNVVATHWEPAVSGGTVVGFRVRLLETAGRRCRTGMRAFRPVKSAKKTNLAGEQPAELSVQGDRITMDLGAYEWVQVEAEFAR